MNSLLNCNASVLCVCCILYLVRHMILISIANSC